MRVDAPFSNYGSTRLDADVQRSVNLYPHSKGGVRQFPGLVEYSNFGATSYDSKSIGSLGSYGAPLFNDDGTECYICGTSGNTKTITCSTPWDISTGTVGSAVAIPTYAGAGGPTIMLWGKSGTRLYFCDLTDFNIYQYNCSTAYDISTISNAGVSLDCSGEMSGTLFYAEMSADGTKIFASEFAGRIIYVYNLSTPYEAGTGTYSSTSKDLSSDIAKLRGLRFSPAGDILIVADGTSADLTMYQLTTGFDVGTMGAAASTFSVSAQTTDSSGICFGDSGDKLYLQDASANIFQYTIAGYSIYDSSGLNAAATAGITMRKVPYVVIGGSLYSLSEEGSPTLIGAVATATGIATDGTYVVIATGGQPFAYSASGGLVSITDADLGDVDTVAYVDSRFIYQQSDGQYMVSALNDPTSVNALDIATAEAYDDDIEALLVHNQLLYLFGSKTIEGWDTTGVGRPPMDRVFVLERGLIGTRAVDSLDNRIYFLDHDRRPNVMTGQQYQSIYTPALGEAWDSYATVSDCIVNAYTLDQENFAEFYFPTANATWTYHEASGKWAKREDSSNNAFRPSVYLEAYNKTLGIDRATGKVYEFSASTYQDDGSNITRTIDTDVITSVLLGGSDQEIIMNEVALTVQSSGAGTIDVSLSTDLSTFGSARTITLVAGLNRLSLYSWGKFIEGVLRFTTTSNAKISIVKCKVDIEHCNA